MIYDLVFIPGRGRKGSPEAVLSHFGAVGGHALGLLVQLASADWHRRHEDVASALDDLWTPGAVDALYYLTQWVPDYLAWDEDRALARKAVGGLAKTPGPEVEQMLRLLLDDPDEHVRAYAVKRQSRLSQSLAPFV